MPTRPVGYPLTSVAHYMVRPTGSTLLFSLAKKLAKAERRGEVAEYFAGWIGADGEYTGFVLIDSGDSSEHQ